MKGLFFSLLLYDASDALCSLRWMILCFGHYHRRLPVAVSSAGFIDLLCCSCQVYRCCLVHDMYYKCDSMPRRGTTVSRYLLVACSEKYSGRSYFLRIIYIRFSLVIDTKKTVLIHGPMSFPVNYRYTLCQWWHRLFSLFESQYRRGSTILLQVRPMQHYAKNS